MFDSGVGGLTVAARLMQELPRESMIYLGDTARVPYGEKTAAQIRSFVFQIIEYLLTQDVKAVVMACNSSSAMALEAAQARYDVPILGVIAPGAAAAVRATRANRIGVIANAATVRSRAYPRALQADGHAAAVWQKACPLLVPLVERGELATDAARSAVAGYVQPLERQGIDTLILGCTHYPYLSHTIRQVLSRPITLIDPAVATVAALRDALRGLGLLAGSHHRPGHRFVVSGDPKKFQAVGERLLGRPLRTVERVRWA